MEELYFNPDIIAKFQLPETSPLTHTNVELTPSPAQRDQRDPSILNIHMSLQSEVKVIEALILFILGMFYMRRVLLPQFLTIIPLL